MLSNVYDTCALLRMRSLDRCQRVEMKTVHLKINIFFPVICFAL